MKSKSNGLTIIEALVIVAIVATLTAISLPVYGMIKRSARVTESASKMHQAFVALQAYRVDYDGSDGNYASYRLLALPTTRAFESDYLGLGPKFWNSPCGFDQVLFESGPNKYPGTITYAAVFYDPAINNPGLETYLADYRENAVLFLDTYCNPAGLQLRAVHKAKRSVAVTLGGALFNRVRQGDAFQLTFYSDKPLGGN